MHEAISEVSDHSAQRTLNPVSITTNAQMYSQNIYLRFFIVLAQRTETFINSLRNESLQAQILWLLAIRRFSAPRCPAQRSSMPLPPIANLADRDVNRALLRIACRDVSGDVRIREVIVCNGRLSCILRSSMFNWSRSQIDSLVITNLLDGLGVVESGAFYA